MAQEQRCLCTCCLTTINLWLIRFLWRKRIALIKTVRTVCSSLSARAHEVPIVDPEFSGSLQADCRQIAAAPF